MQALQDTLKQQDATITEYEKCMDEKNDTIKNLGTEIDTLSPTKSIHKK